MAKVSQPAKSKAGIQTQAHLAPASSAPALNLPCLWVQKGGGAFLEVQVGNHIWSFTLSRRPLPFRGLPNKGGWGRALNLEPSLHAQPMPRVSSQSAGQAPTRFHHFLPGRRPQGNAGRADRPWGKLPPPLTRRSPVNPRPAICLPGNHLLSRPICSQGSPQGHFTKATVPTGRLPSVGTNRRARQTSPAHHHHHPRLCGFSLLPTGSV